MLHLAALAIVVAQSWLGILCPLTTLEMWLRVKAENDHYDGSFIQYWLQHFLYYDLPEWIFVVVYTGFGLLVVATWVIFPPQKKSHDMRK